MTLRLEKYRFLQYASLYWLDHYEDLPEGSTDLLDEKVLQFLTNPSTHKNVLAWQQVEEREGVLGWKYKGGRWKDRWGNEEPPKLNDVLRLSPVYYAALYGLWEVIRRLVETGYDINTPGSRYGFPVLAAAFGGMAPWDFVAKLVKAGADINAKSSHGTIAFANALIGGPDDWWLLKDLVVAGADVNARIANSWPATTMLEAISQHPSDASEMVEFLATNGADVNGLDYFNDEAYVDSRPKHRFPSAGPPFQQSCYKGTAKVAEVLLNHGARRNFGNCHLGTPLQAAIHYNQENLVHILISDGCDISAGGGALGSPLQAAAWRHSCNGPRMAPNN